MSDQRLVLDSWALLALLQGEPEGKKVKSYIARAEKRDEEQKKNKEKQESGNESKEHIELFLNEINLGEIFYILGRRKGEAFADSILGRIQAGPFKLVSPGWDLVKNASRWKIHHSISLADAFAVATADEQDAKLVTGDPELKDLSEIDVLWLSDKC